MESNKSVLQMANAAIAKGDYEGFLTYCTDDTKWVFIGERELYGKDAVRQYMAETYLEPPVFVVDQLIGEGDFVTAVGRITLKDKNGATGDYSYCDVWRFRDGKMVELKAFVINNAVTG